MATFAKFIQEAQFMKWGVPRGRSPNRSNRSLSLPHPSPQTSQTWKMYLYDSSELRGLLHQTESSPPICAVGPQTHPLIHNGVRPLCMTSNTVPNDCSHQGKGGGTVPLPPSPQCLKELEGDVPNEATRGTVRAIIVVFFVGWNMHTVFSSAGGG